MIRPKIVGFEITLSTRGDGTLEAVYIRLGKGKVAKTKEIDGDQVLADYAKNGALVGIELLAPVKIKRIETLVEPDQRRSFRRALKNVTPQQFVCA
jgi:uncharacterized protein YuzE